MRRHLRPRYRPTRGPHRDCPSAPHAVAHVESATPGPHGAWLVDYVGCSHG